MTRTEFDNLRPGQPIRHDTWGVGLVIGSYFDSTLNCGMVSWKSYIHSKMFQSTYLALHLMITRKYVVEWTPKPPVHPEYRVAKAEPKPKEPWESPYVDLHAKSTRVLLVLLDQARASGRAPNGATCEELKAILATREHLPSAKELRQRKAKEKRYR